MSLLFECDGTKARNNLRKHGVSFEEASTVFADPLSITIEDSQFRSGEFRFVTVGYSQSSQLLVVTHTERNDRIRLISARRATKAERKQYEQD